MGEPNTSQTILMPDEFLIEDRSFYMKNDNKDLHSSNRVKIVSNRDGP